MKEKHAEDMRAAIVCPHVANQGFSILCAMRGEPLEADDSGWQFLCDSGLPEPEAEAKVWGIGEVIAHEPSLGVFIDCPSGTKLVRKDKNSHWEKV